MVRPARAYPPERERAHARLTWLAWRVHDLLQRLLRSVAKGEEIMQEDASARNPAILGRLEQSI